jgi:hypothetical protein
VRRWTVFDEAVEPSPPEHLHRDEPVGVCQPCNRALTKQYFAEFIRFATAGADMLAAIGPTRLSSLDATPGGFCAPARFLQINRLRVTKQIIAMMLVTCGRRFVEAHIEMARFTEDPARRGVPTNYRLYLALCPGPRTRVTGMRATVDRGRDVACVEIVSPPFEYLLILDGTDPDRAGEISDWFTAPDRVESISAVLPIAFCHTPIPHDLRSRGEIDRDQRLRARSSGFRT